jgi:hypothetical protein
LRDTKRWTDCPFPPKNMTTINITHQSHHTGHDVLRQLYKNPCNCLRVALWLQPAVIKHTLPLR